VVKRRRLRAERAIEQELACRGREQILAAHDLRAGEPQMLDAANEVSVTPWRRGA